MEMVREHGDASFGALLQRFRKASGFTQEELAAKAGLTAKAISALERGERRRPYPHTVRSLADALDLPEDERASLLAAVPKRGSEAPSGAPAAAPGGGLPNPPTELLGREREVSEITRLLGEARLLTLTGMGGVGKTRLAMQITREVSGLFPDGAAFVGLASLGDSSIVVPTIVKSLGVGEAGGRHPVEAAAAHLSGRRFLLAMDNFEHVLEAAPEVAELMEACPLLTILATSRAPLRLRGEVEYPVQPLALPASTQRPEAAEVLTSPAGRLFVERAKAASHTFSLEGGNAPAVASICWRLSGLPLALELAATKVRHLDCETLLSRLDRALSAGWARDLPERQRTMRATLDWSHDLLHAPERDLFRRLSVFAGGWTLEASEAVVGSEDALDLLGNLVEQSLVTATPTPGGTRYGMLEPVRQYAMELLEESGEAEWTRRRHAEYHLALGEREGPKLKGPRQADTLRLLVAELDNLRAALSFSIENGMAGRVAEISYVSWTFWWSSGNLGEGRRWMEEALAKESGLSDSARAKLLFVAATLGQAIGDWEHSRLMLEESRALFERLGDEFGVADALGSEGLVALGQGRAEEGFTLMSKAVDLKLEVGDEWGAAAMLGFSATVPLAKVDLDRARALAERGLSLAREVGARDVIYVTLHPLATIALMEGEDERANRLFEEGLSLSFEVGEKANVAFCLEGLAAVSASTDKPERAARLWGATESLLEEIEVISYPYASDRSLRQSRLEKARETLGEKSWAKARAEGRAMTPNQAVEYALGNDPDRNRAKPLPN